MSEPLAHSARPERGIAAQTYRGHVSGVRDYAEANARRMVKYFSGDGERLIVAVRHAAEFHDLGKLDSANQDVLAGGNSRIPLPINHVDAGVAHLITPASRDMAAAICAYAHHIGLPNFVELSNGKSGYVLRNISLLENGSSTREHVNALLMEYAEQHRHAMGIGRADAGPEKTILPTPLSWRLALSCLVDADHHDTAKHYGEPAAYAAPGLCAENRLALLDAHIRCLAKPDGNERQQLRTSIYDACRSMESSASCLACDSPVGTGKTTAIMAHLLKTAAARGLRRVFVVLPFTNIIDQSVDVYRRSLVFLNERPEDVVAAHHHRAEFDDPDCRQFSFLWHAPVVVTTAVQFFETLAANRPSSLRKLHQLAGSAIFLDEAHAALPSPLWPQAWKWLQELCQNWGCHVVLGSGSLARFWTLEEFSDPPQQIDDLVSLALSDNAKAAEHGRIRYGRREDAVGLPELLQWVPSVPGPRLFIVNTIQSAAVIADALRQHRGPTSAEHLSTSLCPSDRKKTLERIKSRLRDPLDLDWTLVATSCVEAGVDISFRNGFRESCSLNSLIQTSGRVNREDSWTDSAVWDFRLRYDDLLKQHPAFKDSADVLAGLFAEQTISASLCTESMRREVRRQGLADKADLIANAEKTSNFPEVAELFRVIDSDTVTVVVDPLLATRLDSWERVTPQELQLGSVQMWKKSVPRDATVPARGFPSVLVWKLSYDSFIGYMRGILELRAFPSSSAVF